MTKPEPVPRSIPPRPPEFGSLPKKSSGDSPLFPGFTRREASIRTTAGPTFATAATTKFTLAPRHERRARPPTSRAPPPRRATVSNRSHNKIHISRVARQGSRRQDFASSILRIRRQLQFWFQRPLSRAARICTKLRNRQTIAQHGGPGSHYQQQYVNCRLLPKFASRTFHCHVFRLSCQI